MRKFFLATIVVVLESASMVSAQVAVRVPFVRVDVGGSGVYVRAPFVNLYVPNNPPPYYIGPPPLIQQGPPPGTVLAPQLGQPRVVAPGIPQPLPPGPVAPPQANDPNADPDLAPPIPTLRPKAPTLEQFAKSFKPKAGHYEVTIINPVTSEPATVRFSLPAEPERVNVGASHIVFQFGALQYVRIEFDRDGVLVMSRL